MPDVSVIVPTRDRPAALERCLRALSRQTLGDALEIIVVDDGSRPGVGGRRRLGVPSRTRHPHGRPETPPRRGTREYARPPAESSA